MDIDTTATLSGEPTEQTERLRPKEVLDDGTKISSLKSQVVTEECIKHDLNTIPEKQKADVDQSSLGTSVSTVQTLNKLHYKFSMKNHTLHNFCKI